MKIIVIGRETRPEVGHAVAQGRPRGDRAWPPRWGRQQRRCRRGGGTGARHLGGLGPGHRPGREDRHRLHQRAPVPQRGVRVPGRGGEVLHRRPGRQELQPDFAVLYDRIAAQRVPPDSFYVAEDGAGDITGQFITDACCDPVSLGGPDEARAMEDLAWLLVAAMNDGVPVFYRFAVPGEL